jgi:hypothetical protein
MTDYKNKYIKYKNKYLELKNRNQEGRGIFGNLRFSRFSSKDIYFTSEKSSVNKKLYELPLMKLYDYFTDAYNFIKKYNRESKRDQAIEEEIQKKMEIVRNDPQLYKIPLMDETLKAITLPDQTLTDIKHKMSETFYNAAKEAQGYIFDNLGIKPTNNDDYDNQFRVIMEVEDLIERMRKIIINRIMNNQITPQKDINHIKNYFTRECLWTSVNDQRYDIFTDYAETTLETDNKEIYDNIFKCTNDKYPKPDE